VLRRLHDRTPGVYVERTLTAGDPPGTPSWDYVYVVKEDGSVDRVHQLEDGYTEPLRCVLQTPIAYQSCLDSVSSDGNATIECQVTVWAIDCVPGPVSCD
jgi:hypothetical protein